jgi:hypothetical protein
MILGDSTEYELLAKWAATCKNNNLSCEIGIREGLGSKVILDHLKPNKHIGIDPYGNLNYQHYDDTGSYQCDYTESMRLKLLKDMADAGYENFDLFHMTDIDFMNKFYDAGPFDFVHFDGPHMTKDVIREVVWFADRSTPGTRFVFDDYPKYNMSKISDLLGYWDFRQLEAGKNKICLEKQ